VCFSGLAKRNKQDALGACVAGLNPGLLTITTTTA
jgi:hypothetical protein